VTVPVRKIAHWTQVSREALADFGSFEQVVANEMTAGVILQENAQVLSGDGLGTNLVGLTGTSGIQVYTPAAAEARILSILHGITLLRTGSSFVEADRIILNPTDWEIVLKYAATTGELVVSPTPTSATAMSLWGTPVTVTSQQPAGQAIVANLAASSVIFSREPVQLYVDVFGLMTSNMIRIVAEERLALGVTRPSAVVKITFSGTA
jgi:HK97 family phage major capsid protein